MWANLELDETWPKSQNSTKLACAQCVQTDDSNLCVFMVVVVRNVLLMTL